MVLLGIMLSRPYSSHHMSCQQLCPQLLTLRCRSFSRVVMVAGTTQQVEQAVAAAEPFKQQLVERGVLVVPLPIFGAGADGGQLPKPQAEDLR